MKRLFASIPMPTMLRLAAVSSALFIVACAGTERGEDPDRAENEVKKKVEPQGGNGAFVLVPPDFDATRFAGTFEFDDSRIEIGKPIEKVPGHYRLTSSDWARNEIMFDIVAGQLEKMKASGLRVRYAEPVTFGSTDVSLSWNGGLAGTTTIGPHGVSLLTLNGKATLVHHVGSDPVVVDVPEGGVADVVLPTTRVVVQLDAYDSAFPTPTCDHYDEPQLMAGTESNSVEAITSLRYEDGSPKIAFVVAHGNSARVSLFARGIVETEPTVAGETITFNLNRLEVDDFKVTLANGESKFVKGEVSVEREQRYGFQEIACKFPTHSGIDVPDGKYRITSTVITPSGPMTQVREVTFP